MTDNIASVSWGDHLVFGEGDGQLTTPQALANRILSWREDLDARILHWRLPNAQIPGQYNKSPDYPDTIMKRTIVDWDYFKLVPTIAHQYGLEAYLYVSIFDEGFPLASVEERKVSYHNAMHGQHIAWQSDFSRRHPEFALVDRNGLRQWGVLSLAYPQVREHFRRVIRGWLARGEWDGLFVCLRSQSRPADYADQFGFNEPICQDYLIRYGCDIRKQDFDLQLWRDLRGEYLTAFIGELRKMTQNMEMKLALGVPRGDVLGPPMDNRSIAWREWIGRDLIDDLVINQNSSVCPSMWHDLWPMHRGFGYLQNYLDGFNLRPLLENISEDYSPVIAKDGTTRLFVGRQWDARSKTEESELLNHPAVSGLVFSTFRHDNPEAIKRGDWVA